MSEQLDGILFNKRSAASQPDETKLLLAALLTSATLNDRFTRLPPHITVIPPFMLAKSVLPVLHTEMDERMIENQGFRASAGELRKYGDSNERWVRKMYAPIIDFGIHAAAHALVRHLGGRFDQRYTGLAWSPHMSDIDALAEGETIEVDQLQLFEYGGSGTKTVIGQYSANGSVYETAA